MQQDIQQKGDGNPKKDGKKGDNKTRSNNSSDGNPSGGNNPGETPNSTATGVSAAAADALMRMSEDYHSNNDFIRLLIVTCLDENDPSRFHNIGEYKNEWLSNLCTDINSVDKIVDYIRKIAELDHRESCLSVTATGAKSSGVNPGGRAPTKKRPPPQ